MKLLGFVIPLSFCVSIISAPLAKIERNSAPQLIGGGTVSFDFANPEDVSRFDLYTSYESNPSFVGDTMYSYLYAEQKVILRDVLLSEYLIEADFGPSVYKGHIDMGFYIKAANPSNSIDQIQAWQVNIKHDDNTANWDLRLYQFDNAWIGQFAEEANMPFWNDEWIHLSVLVKNGIVSAYINNNYDYPMLNYNIGTGAGLVGIRSFKSPAKVRNIQITSPSFEINTSKLSALINECNSLNENDYTPVSWGKFESVLNKANGVLSSPINQLVINDVVKELQSAKDGLLLKKNYQQLQELISECEQITDSGSYTQNSWGSFIFCLNRAKQLTESASVEDISFNYMMLEYRKNELVRYGG